MKWIAVAGVLVVIVLAVLLRAVTDGDAAPSTAPGAPAGAKPTTGTGPAPAMAPQGATLPTAGDRDPPIAIVEYDAAPQVGPFRARSEPFWERADSYQKNDLLRSVNDCYKGGQDAKAKLKVTYKLAIRNGEVRLDDLKVEESTLTDPALQECMLKTLRETVIKDAHMPDFQSPDTERERMLIRIETLKRFRPPRKDGDD